MTHEKWTLGEWDELIILIIMIVSLLVLVIAWGRVKLRINITRVFRNCRNCPSRDNFCQSEAFELTVSFTSKNTHSPETVKISVVSQSSEQVKAYNYY